MTTYPAPAPTYIKARHYATRDNKPIKRIVLHGTVSDCREGMARIIARYFATTSTVASAHYTVDPGEVIQSVYDSHVAFHDGTNDNSLGIEMCDPVEGPLTRWDDDNHRRMLRRTARLVAELCLAYDVPPKYRTPVGVKLGRKGITTHNVMRLAFPGSTTHWDPGKWPRRRFMRLVREEVAAIVAEAEKPADPPKPTRVSRARVLLEEALDKLAGVPKNRAYVRRVTRDLRANVDRLPER